MQFLKNMVTFNPRSVILDVAVLGVKGEDILNWK